MRNSARELTSDITEKAGRAALQAEQDVFDRKQHSAVVASDVPPEEGRVNIAGAETAHQGNTPQEEALARWENPLRRLLQQRKPDPASDGDPFLQAERTAASEAASTAKGKSSGGLLNPKETAARPSPFVTSSETRRPEQTGGSTPVSLPTRSVEPLSPAAATAGPPAWAQSSEGAPRVVGPTPPEDWRSPRSTGPSPAGKTADSRPAAQSATTTTHSDAADRLSEQRLRMRVLLSDARTHALRGELHAAYRSALLAEKIADDHQIPFAANEQHPRDLAKQIATRIWQSAEQESAADAAARKTDRSKSSAADQAGSPASDHDRTFSDAGSLSRWSAVGANTPASLDTAPSDLANDSSSGSEHLKSPSQPSSDPVWRFSAQQVPPANRAGTERDASSRSPWNRAGTSGSEEGGTAKHSNGKLPPFLDNGEGVTFAIAQTVEEIEPEPGSSTETPAPRFSPAPFPDRSETRTAASRLRAEPPERERPVLPAPRVAAGEQTAFAEETFSWDEELAADDVPSTAGEQTVPGAAPPSRNLRWGVIGFIAAVLSTVIGLRLSRGTQPPSGGVAERKPEEEQEEESPHLRIKRAA